MNFLASIFRNLEQGGERTVLREIRDGQIVSVTCRELLASIRTARSFLTKAGLVKGDRCALLAHNGIGWAALDVAMMAEGIIVVPLYARQAPSELVGMMKDCSPSLICCGDETLRDGIAENWSQAPPIRLFDEIFASPADAGAQTDEPVDLVDQDAVTIIYTSGTSGEPKGVVLNVGNLSHMIPCTNDRLELLMDVKEKPDQVFHYLPFCFAGSWILMLTCLSRNSVLTLSTDLTKLTQEMKLARPHYFLNVPTLLERLRQGIENQLRKRGSLSHTFYEQGRAAWFRCHRGERAFFDGLWLRWANALIFPVIRKRISPNLKALICGSAPLAEETQIFFMMMGVPVLQVYGLTETTAICTMDHPYRFQPGRVGPAVGDIQMKLGKDHEILVKGSNIFPGYWNRPEQTAEVLRQGWFHTGDQGDVDESGNWRIIGRLKNLLVLRSGHNVAPEPIERAMLEALPGAEQVMLVGHGRSYLAAIVTGEVRHEQVERALEAVNADLPHYKRIRAFHLSQERFTIENGLLTANGKLKRGVIRAHFRSHIEDLYRAKTAGEV